MEAKEAYKKAIVTGSERTIDDLWNAIGQPFDEFLENCVINDDPILVNDKQGILTKGNIEKLKGLLDAAQSKEEKEKVWTSNDDDLKIVKLQALWIAVFVIDGWDHKKNISNALTGKDAGLNGESYKYTEGSVGISSAPKFFSPKKVAESFISLWSDLKGLKDVQAIKDEILNRCYDDKRKINVTLRNELLFLCSPDKYEPILANSTKEEIIAGFKRKVDDNELKNKDTDAKLQVLREKLTEEGKENNFSFFSAEIMKEWKKGELSTAELLEYKKAIILYGPPGTGKTHDANELIEEINNRWRKDCNEDEVEQSSENYVLKLQMHANYSYDDFVIGIVFEDGKTVVKRGALLQFIDKMDSEHPYFVVLDEINRVDISRVFGEVFSAMEYRGKEFDLPYWEKLCIPENLYFIGTMNEIDFSLEHIDFALRRRFLWVRKGFDENALEAMIKEKCSEAIKEEYIKQYIETCKTLNGKIKKELGENYEIGHTFFAEIVPIWAKLHGGNDSESIKQAKQILWQISIKPTLEAYCGSMSEATRLKFIGEDAKGNPPTKNQLSTKEYKDTCRYLFLNKERDCDRQPAKNSTNGETEGNN